MLIVILVPVVIINGLFGITKTRYVLTYSRKGAFTKFVIMGEASDLTKDLLLIPRLGANGALIGTLTAETVACVWQ